MIDTAIIEPITLKYSLWIPREEAWEQLFQDKSKRISLKNICISKESVFWSTRK